jgi:two-component system, NarL family, sensor histidine kinase NreB
VPRRSRFRERGATREPTPPERRDSELSRHLLRAQEEERKRISRELHDAAGQGLMVLRLFLGTVAGANASADLRERIQEAIGMVDRTIGDLRRLIARLSPRTLEEMGLVAAIRKEARELSRSTGMQARMNLPTDLRELDDEIELAVYRAVQEALNNIAKHSQAKSFSIQLEASTEQVRLRVEDDGIGFAPNSRSRGFGLFGMRERIAVLGGTVRVRTRPGKGTHIVVSVPLSTGQKAAGAKPHSLTDAIKPDVHYSHVH